MKPVLFVTGNLPAYRVGALTRLHERELVEVALFGGRSLHGGPAAADELPFPTRAASAAQLARMAASGRFRAVVCPTGGRLAPAATWAGARLARVPLLLWASLWAHPRSAAHALSYLPLRRLYRSADAVVTYGPHVSAYVRARGARNVHVAPQSVDNEFWGAPGVMPPNDAGWPAGDRTRFLFVGRRAPEKGLDVLLAAWRSLPPDAPAALVLVRAEATQGGSGEREARVVPLGPLAPERLREVYAGCHVLVVPSRPTRTFREPWGLVVNEAMNRGLAVIATDSVGAAAGGLVRDGHNGLVVPAADAAALRQAIERLCADPALRARLGEAARRDVREYSHQAWAEGFSRALASVGVSRGRW